MKKIILSSIFAFLILGIKAQQTNYQDGVFILNEDWFGHNNSTINFISKSSDVFYRVYEYENQGRDLSLGCTSQYGMIYGDNMLIISKQDKDDGDSRIGGRVIVADATKLTNKRAIKYILQNDQGSSIADGRSCLGVDENTAYIGTNNGIFVFDLISNQIMERISGTENPLVNGDENNANGQGAFYNNQIGHMIRTPDYVFAVYQDSGIFVIDPNLHKVKTVIKGCFSSMVQSKDGYIWAACNTNHDAQKYPYGGSNFSSWGDGWEGSRLLRIDPFSLETSNINIPSNMPGIRQTWYAWTNGGFCASAVSNYLYWTDDNAWFESSKIYRYDINNNTFKKIFDAKDIHADRNIYGAGFGVNPENGNLFVFLFNSFTDNRNWIAELDENGNIIENHSLIQNYWFPSMSIFPDKYDPELSTIPETISIDKTPYKLYLGDCVTDADNLNAAIVKSVKNIGNSNLANIFVKHDTLNISRISPKIGGDTRFNLAFNSNGKIITKNINLKISSHLYLQNPIEDIFLKENNPDTEIDISNYFILPGVNNNLIQLQVESNSNEQLINCNISNNKLHISTKISQYGIAKLIIKASAKGEIERDTVLVNVDAKPVLLSEIPEVVLPEDNPEFSINLAQYFHDLDNDDSDIIYTIQSNTNSSLLTGNISGATLTLKLKANQFGMASLQLKANSNGQTIATNLEITVNPVDDPIISTKILEDIYLMENSQDSTINLSVDFTDPDNDDNLIKTRVISNSNTALVNHLLNNNNLTLSFEPNHSGYSEIIIQGALNGYTQKDTFNVYVKDVDQPIFCNNLIEDSIIIKNAPDIVLNLSNIFSDPDDNDALINISVIKNSGSKLIQTSVNGQMLTIHPEHNKSGIAELIVEGSLNGFTANDIFNIKIDDPIYLANPINDIIVQKNGIIENIDISNVFNDNDDNNQNIVTSIVSNSMSELVQVAINENQLAFDLSNDKTGETQIILKGELLGYSANDTIMVRIVDPVYVANSISDFTVPVNSETQWIDISNVFVNPSTDNQLIDVELYNNSNQALVIPEIKSELLILNFSKNMYGKSEMILKATSGEFYTFDTLMLTVDKPLYVKNHIYDIFVNRNSEDKYIKLKDIFDDPDNNMDAISYNILSNSNENLLNISILNDTATLSFSKNFYGEAEVIIEAQLNNYIARDTFLVTVNKTIGITKIEDVLIKIYPNFVKDILNIECSFEINRIVIYNCLGNMIKMEKTVNNTHHKINISNLIGGTYFISIEGKNNRITKKIIKQ
ncbi:MAG: DUF5074 domain-containing protein [Bacteroidetes bacterium]|nr:DUF5074 domain-containing protein [Bacteroidota bacterium]